MCRLGIYKGPKIPLSRFVLNPPHSILKQSYDAQEMLSGSANTDGFGIAWYNHELSPAPAVYKNILPIANDPNLPSMAEKISSEIILAHVRGASDGMPITITNTHPFSHEQFVFMHNGAIDGFRKNMFPDIVGDMEPTMWDFVKGNTDSEHFFGLWLSRLHISKLENQISALREITQKLEKLAAKYQSEIVLNTGISDGKNVVAMRHHFGRRKATLYVVENSKMFPSSVVIASERMFDDENWRPVPEKSIVVVNEKNRLTIEPL